MKPEVQYLLETYTGDKFLTDNDNLERSGEFEDSDYSLYQNRNLRVTGDCDGGWRKVGVRDRHLVSQAHCAFYNNDGLNRMQFAVAVPEVHVRMHGPLNASQRQHIRTVSINLKIIADNLEIRPSRNTTSAEQIIQDEGLDESERQVVNNIYSLRHVTTVSTIANYLEDKLTSRTMRAALQYLCDGVCNASEELAVVCELVKLTAPKIRQLSRSTSINDVISEFVEERLPIAD